MDLLKQYIIQAISSASNNLRLSTEKIEVVALLRQSVNQSVNLEEDFKKMKRITQLSKLAIKLNEIYNYLAKEPVDFQKLSYKFNEHSQYLIKDLNQMLESVSPALFKTLLDKVQDIPESEEAKKEEEPAAQEPVQTETPADTQSAEEDGKEKSSGNGSIDSDQEFIDKILKPIRPLDDFLKKIGGGNTDPSLIDEYLLILQENGISSYDKGYGTVADMHDTIYKALRLLKSGGLKPTKEVTESMRACLIVIATLIRNKAVDINSYLNLAEEFGKKIETIKQE